MAETTLPLATAPTVFEALSRVMADVQAVGKGDRNREQGYDFRGIDAVVNAVGPKLREHGVLVVPELIESAWRDVRTSRDKPARECTVKVRYTFYGPAGDSIVAVTPGESMDFGDKGAAKAMSVAFRIALLQALAIPTHEPDPDSSSYERADASPSEAWGVNPAAIRGVIAKVGKNKGMAPDQIAADFEEWSKGVHIAVTEDTRLLSDYLAYLQEAPA